MQACRNPSTVQLVKRLEYSNLLGLDVNLKRGRLRQVAVGDFYEALGIDACILVEYAGLNPFGGLRSDSIPRAGCPVVDDLTRNGYSVCVVEEVQGPTQAGSRKSCFISGYLFEFHVQQEGETMQTYSSEDALTKEALVTKLRTCWHHHLFLHTSLRHNSSGLYSS
ncbi:hypothetical protein FNV43_RR00193 [Rhamnella rubrinervis]|uniref:Uncharacterized protein n=1 Tax=Rhamnella rubrinervis TaxID=2594499 RepID=A0A8K0HN46_9ROSA|nr:hypothetical protein FNV43_RR00193 [Rhamnella rubrinervis]